MEVGVLPTFCRGGRPCPPARLHRRVFRLPRRSVQYAPVSRFIDLKYTLAETKLLGKSKKGGRNPLLGRFKGDCKEGAPARIQRSDSRGKRRNNGTDEISRLRGSEGGEVCSDANSPFAVFFLPPGADRVVRPYKSLPCKEKGVESFPAPLARIRCALRAQKILPHPPDAVPSASFGRVLCPPGIKRCHPSGVTKSPPRGGLFFILRSYSMPSP